MTQFSYQARDASGAMVAGLSEADNRQAVAAQLLATGLTPTLIEESRESSMDLEALSKRFSDFFKPRVSLDDLVIFSRQMASLARAGVPVTRGLKGLSDSVQNETFREVLQDVMQGVEGGMDLASSLARHKHVFSDLFVSVVHVGENTGKLDESFAQMAGYLEMERDTRRRVSAAMRYPTFVLCAIGIAIVVINIFVIPAFAGVFEQFGSQLPWQTRALIGISDFFVNQWPWLAAGGIGAWFGIRHYLSTDEGRMLWDRFKLRAPVIGPVFEKTQLARFCDTFAMVMQAGVPMVQGLAITARALGNKFMEEKVHAMRSGIERGDSITRTAVASGMFSPVILQMLAVGEETGSVDDLLRQASRFYDEEVDYLLKGLTDAIEPILVIAIGIMVLILALGVFLPLWDLSSATQK